MSIVFGRAGCQTTWSGICSKNPNHEELEKGADGKLQLVNNLTCNFID